MLLLAACTEYGVTYDDKPVDETGTSTTSGLDSQGSTTAADSDGGSTTVPTAPCDDLSLTDGTQWWGSPSFDTEADWTDGAGRPFYAVDFDLADWSTVSMPDEGHIPAGSDRAYRGEVEIPELRDRIFVDLQSDDGIWLYVNGTMVGHWGGDWQEEGCVNDEAECVVTSTVDPVDVSDWLATGTNLFAARVSNAVDNAYFMLHARCEAS